MDKILHELDNRMYTKKYLVNWVLYNLIKKQEKFIEDNLAFYQQDTITLENLKTRIDSLVNVFEPTGNLAIYFNSKIDLTELNEFYQKIEYTKDTNLSLVTEKHATFNSEYEEILRKITDQIDYHFYDDIKSVNLNFNETGVPYLTPLNNVPITRVNTIGILDECVDYTYDRLPNKPSLKKQLNLMTKYPTVIKEVKNGLAKFDLPGITNLKLSDLTYTDFIETIIVNFVNYLVVYVVSQYEHTTSIIDIEMNINKIISLKVSIILDPSNDTSNLKLLDKSGKYQFKASELKLFY